jgi:hypothetical protein
MDIFTVYFRLHVKRIFSADPELLELDTETGILSPSAELFEYLPTDMRYRCSSSGRHTVVRSLSLRRQQLAYPLRSLSFPLQPLLPRLLFSASPSALTNSHSVTGRTALPANPRLTAR